MTKKQNIPKKAGALIIPTAVHHPDYLRRATEAPAKALDRSIDAAQSAAARLPSIPTGHPVQRTKDYWHSLGPGLTTGASDDDPSGIATYSQAGAQYGFQFLWLSWFTFPLMAIVQEMCARIGLVTGRGLAGNIRIHFPKKMLYFCTLLLFSANTFNIGADLGAMAKGVQLLAPQLNFTFLVITLTIVSLGLQVFTPYAKYAKYLKWLALILLSYILSAIMAHLDWSAVFHFGLIPHLSWSKDQLLLVAAILGTTISPYLFFWQTSQENEEQISASKTSIALRKGTDKKELKSMRIDVWSGMLLSNVVMFFIIAASGGLLYKNGIHNITSAAQAAEALRPFAGNLTYTLFAIGIIGTGLLAIPVLAASSSYAVSESFLWKGSLNQKLKQAHAFYGVIIISMMIGLALNFIGLNPIKALIYSAVGNAVAAPIVLYLIVKLSSDRKVMGEWKNRRIVTISGWFVVLLMSAAAVGGIWALF
jgi:NRAMP (natural resistance-associated macrophage protein)-like metal ion transporter